MIKFSDFLSNLLTEAPKTSYHAFRDQSSKEEITKIHEQKHQDPEVKKATEGYIKAPETVNPYNLDREQTSSQQKRREHFHHHMSRAHAAGSGMTSTGSGMVFRGQGHPMDVDASGHTNLRRPFSVSTNAAIANANARRNQSEYTK